MLFCKPSKSTLLTGSSRAGSNTITKLPCRRAGQSRSRRLICTPQAGAEAASLIQEGKRLYSTGNRMGALAKFDASLIKDPDESESQEALYSSVCVHASFGDLELARFSLRKGIECGLDFESKLKDPDYLNIETSPQILTQLKRFSKSYVPNEPSEGITAQGLSAEDMPDLQNEKDTVSGIALTETMGIDSSVSGIFKRLLLVLVVLPVAYVLLFYIGYEYTFSK